MDGARRTIALTGVWMFLVVIALQFGRVALGTPQLPDAGEAPAPMAPAPKPTADLGALPLFQAKLATQGVITVNEYIEYQTHPANGSCTIAVRSAQINQTTGWLCYSDQGLYRADLAGQVAGPVVGWASIGY